MASIVSYVIAVCMALVPIMAAPTDPAPPAICHGQDCPKFTMLNKTKDWELRRYAVTKWSATSAVGMYKDPITSELFQLLFRYISGDNAQKAKIAMTTPVLTQIIHGAGPNCESEFIMHFMLPFVDWDTPSTPTNPKVSVVETAEMDVYVRSFGGFAKDQDFMENLHNLTLSLPADAKVEDKYFFNAVYDGPYTFKNRHNEVWVKKV